MTPDKLAKEFARRGVNFFYYMAPEKTMEIIMRTGIFSYNFILSNKSLKDSLSPLGLYSVSDPMVQRRRDNLVVSCSGRPLHDYVPLYMATNTPMQYILSQKNDNISLLKLSVKAVFNLDNVIITDGNAASQDTSFFNLDSADFATILQSVNWRILREERCWSKEYKRQKAAEVLVPDLIPAGCFIDHELI